MIGEMDLTRVLTVKEAAHLLGVSERRIYQLILEKKLWARRADGTWLIDRSSVEHRIQTKREAHR